MVALSVWVVDTAMAGQAAPPSRVRSDNPLIADSIAGGIAGSPVFRRLIETIDATDGLVYIEDGDCGHAVRSCFLHSITISGPNRVLRILVNPHKVPGCELATSVGHELQHAIEVLSDYRVRNSSALFHFFQRLGTFRSGSFETTAAIDVGANIRKELCRRRD